MTSRTDTVIDVRLNPLRDIESDHRHRPPAVQLLATVNMLPVMVSPVATSRNGEKKVLPMESEVPDRRRPLRPAPGGARPPGKTG